MHSKCCLSLQGAALLFVGSASAFPLAFPDGPAGPLPIPRPGSDGSYAGDNYFQYINVPAHKTFEWGYRRGNPDHNREEYLSQKDHTFKAKVNNWPNMSTLSIYCNCILSAEVARLVRRSRRALLRLQPRPGGLQGGPGLRAAQALLQRQRRAGGGRGRAC